MLIDLLRASQDNDQEAMLTLLQRFHPLLKKYGRKLGYEDAEEDLAADFIELVKKLNLSHINDSSDGALTNYISKSVYRLFLKRLYTIMEKEPQSVYIEDMSPTQHNDLSMHTAVWNEETISQDLPQGLLSQKELYILFAIYERGESAASIARKLKVTRQNINQIKKNAERKLKKKLL